MIVKVIVILVMMFVMIVMGNGLGHDSEGYCDLGHDDFGRDSGSHHNFGHDKEGDNKNQLLFPPKSSTRPLSKAPFMMRKPPKKNHPSSFIVAIV